MSDDLDEKFRDVTGNGHDTIDNDDEFRRRMRRQSEEWDRAREQEHRLDFLIAEVRDMRRDIGGRLDKLTALIEQSLTVQSATNEVLDRFMSLANEHDKRIANLEQRPTKRARKK